MKTVCWQANEPEALIRAATLLRAGEIVAFPTDTLYGIGVLAFDEVAIAELFRIKQRPLDKAIPVLLGDSEAIHQIVAVVPAWIQPVMEAFWPGPLTLILPRHQSLPVNLTSGNSVAVRLPDNDVARRLINLAGGAVAATSANRSGQPAAQTAQAAVAALDGLVTAVIDGGPVQWGQGSTILDCTAATPAILRQGPITLADLSLFTEVVAGGSPI